MKRTLREVAACLMLCMMLCVQCGAAEDMGQFGAALYESLQTFMEQHNQMGLNITKQGTDDTIELYPAMFEQPTNVFKNVAFVRMTDDSQHELNAQECFSHLINMTQEIYEFNDVLSVSISNLIASSEWIEVVKHYGCDYVPLTSTYCSGTIEEINTQWEIIAFITAHTSGEDVRPLFDDIYLYVRTTTPQNGQTKATEWLVAERQTVRELLTKLLAINDGISEKDRAALEAYVRTEEPVKGVEEDLKALETLIVSMREAYKESNSEHKLSFDQGDHTSGLIYPGYLENADIVFRGLLIEYNISAIEPDLMNISNCRSCLESAVYNLMYIGQAFSNGDMHIGVDMTRLDEINDAGFIIRTFDTLYLNNAGYSQEGCWQILPFTLTDGAGKPLDALYLFISMDSLNEEGEPITTEWLLANQSDIGQILRNVVDTGKQIPMGFEAYFSLYLHETELQ